MMCVNVIGEHYFHLLTSLIPYLRSLHFLQLVALTRAPSRLR